MPEELKWEGFKREGLAPGFLDLVHQHINGAEDRSPEVSEVAGEVTRWA